ncbi:DUF2242 domain-containing protein [Pelomonas sp. P7]|uniref:DUF2242 domain-containing protein n=1 Tax=Pelomonas caseinilytica TaxID=2906763 RepID=A0ABS8XLU1_9BURK|nr:DUF2242 domain-containing protein [Pelomonas sp. P7]MCE4540033.1 DUF2242 domain-containing protein [Pelomonas sp. P7]
MHCIRFLAILSALSATLLAGCGALPSLPDRPRKAVYQGETFAAEETFSRLFDANVDDTCEAARRALLSQGYVISKAGGGLVQGAKSFQPEGEVHVEIGFHVVCVSDGPKQQVATAYVSAQQDRYALKKNPQAASLGVSALGSISVPLSSTQDSLVKVASETIPAGEFYDRFFTLMQRMLRENAAEH